MMISDDRDKKVPYVYREFPQMMYASGGRTRKVDSTEERDAALASGWFTHPSMQTEPQAPPVKIGAETAAEAQVDNVQDVSEKAAEPQRQTRRGRRYV